MAARAALAVVGSMMVKVEGEEREWRIGVTGGNGGGSAASGGNGEGDMLTCGHATSNGESNERATGGAAAEVMMEGVVVVLVEGDGMDWKDGVNGGITASDGSGGEGENC